MPAARPLPVQVDFATKDDVALLLFSPLQRDFVHDACLSLANALHANRAKPWCCANIVLRVEVSVNPLT